MDRKMYEVNGLWSAYRSLFFLLLFVAAGLGCQYERIDDAFPPLDFSWSPSAQIGVDEVITFTPDAPFAVDFFWEFGDLDTSTLQQPVKGFVEGGRYQVKLTVTTAAGQMISRTREIFIDPFKYKMLGLPGGTFQMGCNPVVDLNCDAGLELPRHPVTLGPFSIGETEVTQKEWQAVTGQNPSTFTGCPDCPVETVSWNDVKAFIDTLNRLSGFDYHLPSEAQWEYAARAGDTTLVYAGANDVNLVAWYGNPSGFPEQVGTKAPNAWFLYDMSGNVFEWCEDYYHDSYNGAPADGSAWIDPPNPTGNRVIRGGSWINGETVCRISARSWTAGSSEAWNFIGFRLAKAQ